MERIELTGRIFRYALRQATNVLKKGGVILYPTDTLYGLGADAFSDMAVEKVSAIKDRDEKKPIHCIVADVAMAERYAEVTADARLLFERLPRGLTIILRKRSGLQKGIVRDIGTIGIRIPNNDFCIQLACAFGKPFTATSANIAGLSPRSNLDAILEQLNDGANQIDLSIDAGELPSSQPSSVVDLSAEEPAILREGAIPAADIWNAIRVERDN